MSGCLLRALPASHSVGPELSGHHHGTQPVIFTYSYVTTRDGMVRVRPTQWIRAACQTRPCFVSSPITPSRPCRQHSPLMQTSHPRRTAPSFTNGRTSEPTCRETCTHTQHTTHSPSLFASLCLCCRVLLSCPPPWLIIDPLTARVLPSVAVIYPRPYDHPRLYLPPTDAVSLARARARQRYHPCTPHPRPEK